MMADDFIPLNSFMASESSPSPANDSFITMDQAASGHPQAGPSDSFLTDAGRRLATAGTDALGSALSVPRLAAQGTDWLWKQANVASHADKALGDMVDGDGRQVFPDPAAARALAYNTTGATEYVPATAPGRFLQAGLAAGVLGGAGGIGAVLPSIAGGATSEAAGEMLPNHPLAARLLGFAFGAKVATGLANTAAKGAGMVTGAADTTPLFQAYQRQNVPTMLSGDVTQNPTLQRLQSIATKMPGGEESLRQAGADTINAWQAAAEKNATLLGPAATMQDAGVGLQNAATQWLQNWKQDGASKWDAFHQAVPGTTPVAVPTFQRALQDVNQNFGGATELAKALQPGLAAKLQDALAADVSPNGTLPWQGVAATRTALGEMLSGAPVADAPQAAIKRLYGALSDDMRAGASLQGPAVQRAFYDANAHTAFGHALLEDHLNPILNAANPEQAAQYALAQVRQGGSRLGAVEHAMPGQSANLGAAVLRQAAENGPSALPAKLKNMSPEAKNLLFSSPTPPSATAPTLPSGPAGTPNWATPASNDPNAGLQGVSDLSDIGQAMRRTVQTTGNNSNTSAHSATGVGRVMAAAELAREGHSFAGVPGALAGGALGLFAPNIIGTGARIAAVNPLVSRLYSTELAPFAAPAITSPNALLQLASPDRRALPGAPQNPLLR